MNDMVETLGLNIYSFTEYELHFEYKILIMLI